MSGIVDVNKTDASDNTIVVGAGVAGTPSGGIVSVQGVSGGTLAGVRVSGVVNTALPSAGSDATDKTVGLSAHGLLHAQGAAEIYAKWGAMFSVTTNSQALTGTTETPLFYFRNPSGSAKTIRLNRMHIGPTLGNNYVTYRLYRNPTVTANGSALTIVGNRTTGQAATAALAYLNPTTSANGTVFKSLIASGLSGQDIEIVFDFSFFVDENTTLLVTRQLSANATIGGIDLDWVEM